MKKCIHTYYITPLLRKNAPSYNTPVFFYRFEMVLPSSNCNDIHVGNVENIVSTAIERNTCSESSTL
jgi:hypothetical protein